MIPGQSSRFAVLAPADENDIEVVNIKTKSSIASKAVSKKNRGKEVLTKDAIPYLVENAAKKPRKKQIKTASTGQGVSNCDDEDNKSATNDVGSGREIDEDIQRAMLESREQFETEQTFRISDEQDIEKVIQESKIGSGSNDHNKVEQSVPIDTVPLPKSEKSDSTGPIELIDVVNQSENEKLRAMVVKCRARLKLYSKLVFDLEHKEMSDVLLENEKLKQLNEDLIEQVSRITVELEQLRSKVSEVEKPTRKAAALKISK